MRLWVCTPGGGRRGRERRGLITQWALAPIDAVSEQAGVGKLQGFLFPFTCHDRQIAEPLFERQVDSDETSSHLRFPIGYVVPPQVVRLLVPVQSLAWHRS